MTRLAILALAGAIAITLPAAGVSGGSRQLRVAYVTDALTPRDPHDFHTLAYRSFLRAVKDFHVQGRVVLTTPRQGTTPTIASLARQRYDLIFITSFFQSSSDVKAFATVASRFPESKFVMQESPYQLLPTKPKNVQGAVWRVEQSAYLAGYLAALMEKRRPGKDVVGSVGGFPFPSVAPFIAGYEAGARRADPGITILRGYSKSFGDRAKCMAVALRQIGKGAGAVFNVAGGCGLGTLDAAREKGVWGIGVDVDQSFLGPHILTSVLKRFDVQAYETVETFVSGRLTTGGNKVWSLRNGAVGLGKISPRVPRSFVRQLEKIRAQIIAGEIKVPSTIS